MKFCYNTNLPFLNNPKDLDPSCKMDLGSRSLGLFWKEKTLSYNQRNTVSLLHSERPKLHRVLAFVSANSERPKLHRVLAFVSANSERPKLYRILAFLSAIGLNRINMVCIASLMSM